MGLQAKYRLFLPYPNLASQTLGTKLVRIPLFLSLKLTLSHHAFKNMNDKFYILFLSLKQILFYPDFAWKHSLYILLQDTTINRRPVVVFIFIIIIVCNYKLRENVNRYKTLFKPKIRLPLLFVSETNLVLSCFEKHVQKGYYRLFMCLKFPDGKTLQ